MIRISEIKIPVRDFRENENILEEKVCEILHIESADIKDLKILRRSIDARQKEEILFVFSVTVDVEKNETAVLKNCRSKKVSAYKDVPYQIMEAAHKLSEQDRPVIIGMGPAGLFCAYVLAKKGFRPILLERGKPVEERTKDVLGFWYGGSLNPMSNAQFGEGGAGTFSDGKLNTLVKDPYGYNRFVLETFVRFGADESILYDYKPHIGTDCLRDILTNFRKELIRLGCEIRFSSMVTDFEITDGKLTSLTIGDTEKLSCSKAVLAIGHSARDTFQCLHDRGIAMQAKEFAVGLRVEHPQAFINESQFGIGEDASYLGAAPYKLTAKTSQGRGVYSFCMCPGGVVVNAATEPDGIVVNGMSNARRDGENANAAVVVTVGEKEFDLSNPLSGMYYQRELEKKAYQLGMGKIPQQLLGDFIHHLPSTSYGRFDSAHQGEAKLTDLNLLFSTELREAFLEGMEAFDKKIKGFAAEDVILSGIESRTSSPVRIPRNEAFLSNVKGLYPCGEGAGYAGGITSAAMDGIKVAEAVSASYES